MSIIRNQFKTYTDERGDIQTIAQNVDVLNITSKKGSKRAAHYHKFSSHLCKLNYGEISYYERPATSQEKPIKVTINPGDYFFSDKMVEHLMKFEDDSEFLCFSFGSRNKEDYENDLVRIDWDLEEIYNSLQE
jgi:hypothetical protein